MPIQAPQWTDYLNCPACCREFSPRRSPISLSCGHTLCRPCLKNLIRKQCPFDQSVISMDLEELVVNTALLQLMGYDPPTQPSHPSSIQNLSEQDRRAYDVIVKSLEQLAVYLKYCCTASVNMIGSRLSRPMQRKLVTLLQCSLMDEEGRGKAARAARSLGERTVSELILQHQNPQQLSANLWAAVRSRGCQFLGPAMQEEVLKLVLLALEDGSPLSRKVLVMFVVQRLEPHFPQASKTSIGHVVQLLYRASCFKVSKRESDSSLMQLKEEFRTYECLRREHDAQIVQIATESGLRIAPDQWSALLYGDTIHKSHMQSIIDKLQTPHSFAQSVQELFFALQRTGDPAQLLVMSISLDRLTNIDLSPDAKSPNWQELSQIMTSLKDVVSGLVDYMQHHAAARDANHNLKTDRLPDATTQPSTVPSLLPGRYKVAMCRDAQTRTFCPRGSNCTYAHTEEELERYRGQDNLNMPAPRYPVSPQPMAPRSAMGVPIFNYRSPGIDNRYIGMRSFSSTEMQQLSPSGRQLGMPENIDVPDTVDYEYVHRRVLRHQYDVIASNNPIRSYAHAVVYGAGSNRQPQNQNGGVATLDVGIGHSHSIRVISPQGVPLAHLGGVTTPVNRSTHALSMGMGPNSEMIVLNENMGQYSGGFSPLGDARNPNNGGLLPNYQQPKHQPPTDSRYFPKKTAYSQPQNNSAQMAYQGTPFPSSVVAEYTMPDYSSQLFGANVSEVPSTESFGLGSEATSRYEAAWEPAPTLPIDTPSRTKFRFNKTAKNLPKGFKPYDELPEGFTLASNRNLQRAQNEMNIYNQHIGYNYPSNSTTYNQEWATDQQPLVPAIPNSSDTAVLQDLHKLALGVSRQCSDDNDFPFDQEQE